MSKQQLTSASLDDADVADLDRLCAHLGASRKHLVATAILRFVHEEMRRLPDYGSEWAHLPPYIETDPLAIALNEAEDDAADALRAFLQVGEDDIERGDVITQEEMEHWFAERVSRRARPAAAAE